MQQTTLSKIRYFLYARKSSESEDRQVQSIEDQIARLKELAINQNLDIKQIYTEAKSAKKPNNRPVFDEMIERIEAGEAQGILCWQINRLSRNPIDSAKLQWLLQGEVLKSIQTIDREYRPEDNVLLFSVESGMANQFIIDLRKNTLRGMHSKVEKGWAPVLAPLGYLNEKENHTIIRDPVLFPLVRKMWDLMLTGNYSPSRILEIATNGWGFRTKKYKRKGGTALSLSGMYNLFNSIFYTGLFEWGGKQHQGKHEQMITMEEFNRVQKLLGKSTQARPIKRYFAFTGFIRCGECGCSVTAETHTKLIKKTGKPATFTYYHCTGKKKYYKCSQKRFIPEADLDEQIERELATLQIHPKFRDWALQILRESNDKEIESRTKIYENQHQTLVQTQSQLDNLTRMRYQDLIDDATFIKERNKLQNEILQLRQQVRETEGRADRWLELTERTFTFMAYAHKAFLSGDIEAKKEIVVALGSNPLLQDGKLGILLNKWFERAQNGYAGLEAENERLELDKSLSDKAKTEAFASVLTHWGARRESDSRDRCHRAAFYH